MSAIDTPSTPRAANSSTAARSTLSLTPVARTKFSCECIFTHYMIGAKARQAAFRRSANRPEKGFSDMDWDDALPWFFVISLAPFVMAWSALVGNRRLRAQVAALTEKLGMLDHRVFRLDERLEGGSAAPDAAGPPPTPTVAEPAPAEPTPATASETPVFAPFETPITPPASPAPAASETWKHFEQRFAENWLVWLGGVALALGGAFLVKLSIDHGLLTPPVRVLLAVLLGLGLCGASEWLARRELAEPSGSTALSYVPQALAASGAATVFAAIYGAYQLYELIGPFAAFALLATAAVATVALALRQGIFVAALGLVGAYVVPALVASAEPHALPL